MDQVELPKLSVHGVHIQQDTKKEVEFYTGDTTYACGRAEETAAHMLQCTQLIHSCSWNFLITFNDVGKQCVELWKKIV